jgi:cytochrome c oxidase subunit 2
VTTFRHLLFLPDPLATWSDSVDGLHAVVLLTALVGCLVLFLYTAGTLVFFRTKPPFGTTPHLESTTAAKVLSTGGIFLLFLGWWALGYHTFERMQSPPGDALDIQVVASQWVWKFVYDDGTTSAGVLVVPEDTPIRLLLTSLDVIHSFYVPALRVKRDLVPGQTTTMWFTATHPGTFPAACAEFCGLDHSRMRATLVVLDGPAWAAWVSDRGPLYADDPRSTTLADRGRDVAVEKGCLRCHSVDGTPSVGPTWVGLVRRVPDDTYLTRAMMDPLADVAPGFPPVMPSYRGVLSPEDVGALLAYLRSLADGPEESADERTVE